MSPSKIVCVCSILVVFKGFNCLHFKELKSSLNFSYQNIFQDLFVQQSSLGVAVSGNMENHALMNLHLPMALFSYDKITEICSNLRSELDGYLFFTSNLSYTKTEIIQSLACFNKTTLKLNTKKIVIVIETKLNNEVIYFSWLWQNFGILNLVLVVTHKGTRNVEFLTFNPFVKKTSEEGQLLRFNDSLEATNSFDQVLTNLHGHTLKALVFPFPYGVHPDLMNDSSSIQGGPDLTFLFTLQRFFNVIFEHHKPSDYSDFLRTGTADGALADLSNNCVDILINSKTLKWYDNQKVQFLLPRKFANFVILVKKRGIISGWRIALHLLHKTVWMCLVLAFFMCSAVYTIMRRIRFGTFNFLEGLFVVMKSFLSVCIIHMPHTHPERMLIAFCLMLSVIILNLVFGQMFYLIKSEPQLSNINSLEELQNSNLPIFAVYSNFLYALDGLKNTSLSKLPERLKYKKLEGSTFGIDSKNINDKYAILTSTGSLQMQSYLNGSEYFENIHVLQETVMYFSIAHVMPIGSIYFNQFNTFAIKLVDHGFFNKWLTVYLLYRKEKEINSVNQQNKTSTVIKTDALDLEDLRFPFVIILIGLVLSLVVFLTEILLQKVLIFYERGALHYSNH